VTRQPPYPFAFSGASSFAGAFARPERIIGFARFSDNRGVIPRASAGTVLPIGSSRRRWLNQQARIRRNRSEAYCAARVAASLLPTAGRGNPRVSADDSVQRVRGRSLASGADVPGD